MPNQKLAKLCQIGDYDSIAFCQLYIILADEYIAELERHLQHVIEHAEIDRAAYMGALGHPVLACYDGLLSDGTEPVNVIANHLAEMLLPRGIAGETISSSAPVVIKNGMLFKAPPTNE